MDDRRRTISSEESMIGEALMRVSNTLEAQRLTKSLDYQEKLRTRSNIRLIIAIICICLAFGLLVVGGILAWLLVSYQEPLMGVVLPFLKNMLSGMNTMFTALTETTTYLPILMGQVVQMLDMLLDMMGGIDLSGLLGSLDGLLGGGVDGLLNGMGIDMDTISSMMSNTIGSVAKIADAGAKITDALVDENTVNSVSGAIGDLNKTIQSLLG